MNISYHLDYETIVRGRSELIYLAILFRAAKQSAVTLAKALLLHGDGARPILGSAYKRTTAMLRSFPALGGGLEICR